WRAPARASADFIVATVARNRAQQAPIAMNAALGAVMIVLELTRRGSDFTGLFHPSAALSRVPLLLAFWLGVGLRVFLYSSRVTSGVDLPNQCDAAGIWSACGDSGGARRASGAASRSNRVRPGCRRR